MRLKLYTSLLTLGALFVGGCQSDLLDTSPYNKISSANMWSSESLADQGITGIYAGLNRTPFGSRIWWFDHYGVNSQKRDPESLTWGTIKSNDNIFLERWRAGYDMIHRANDALANLDKAPMSAEKRNRLVGESKFLRAYAYYCLNEVFKGVPVYLEPVEIAEATRARETEQRVWEVIIEDLTACIENTHLPDKYRKGDANFGRATKAAAYALRGKAYMWTKDFAKAEADLKKVGALGHSLLKVTDYKMLFKEVNEQSDEMIFSAQNVSISGLGIDTQRYVGSRVSAGVAGGAGWNHYLPSPISWIHMSASTEPPLTGIIFYRGIMP